MAAQQGRLLLIAIGDGGGPEAFTTVAGLRTKSMRINQEVVDITNSDSTNRYRELLAAGGTLSVSVSGSGVFTDAAVDGTMRTDMVAGTARNWRITVPDFGTFTGHFQMTELGYDGEYNGEVVFNLGLESGGDITFAAV